MSESPASPDGRAAPEHVGLVGRPHARALLKNVHYAWVVAAVTFATVLVGGGVRSSPGVLVVPLETEFHWSRATISFAIGVNILLYGAIGPFAAALMDRFGLRRTLMAAVGSIALGVAATPFMQQSWHLVVLWGVLVGCGCGFAANILAATVATRWFSARRGFVMGLLSSSVAAGQLLFLPVLAAVNAAYGWRAMAAIIAGIAAALLPVIGLFMRDRPEDMGLSPYGEKPGTPPPPRSAGNPFAAALSGLALASRSRDFWLLAGSFFICGASTNGLIGTHLIPACIDHGIPEVTSAGLLGTMAVFNFLGATASGWLSDRIDPRILLVIYYTTRGLSLLYLPFSFVSFYGLSLFAVFYGVDWIATAPPTVRLIANAFGKERTAVTYGWISAVHQLGGATAAYAAGVLRMDFGSYLQAFMISGLLCFLAAAMVIFVGRNRPAADVLAPA